ncbi:hypothetical protein MRX96_014324 [Rhipicephalus microplus]
MKTSVACVVILEDDQKKKVKLQTGLQDELLLALSSLTSVSDDTLIQMYDEEVDDFIDFEPDTPVHNKAKIKLSRKLKPQADCASPQEEVINQPVYTSQAAALSIDAVHPTAGTSNLVVIETPAPVEDRRDYLNFALPSFGCYEELAWYPSREPYRTAAKRLVQKYPHLADKLGAKTSGLESWVLSLRNKFKNMRKKVENCPPEMAEKRAQSLHKRPRQPQGDVLNKKLCRLFDSSHLIVYGETVESIERHNEWLHNHAEFAHQEDIRPRLLATAQEGHECLQSLNIFEALVLFPFLASEASLLLEFDILYKKNVVDEFSQGCQKLCDLALRNGDDIEVAKFSEAAGDNPILAALEFAAARCNEALDVILLEAFAGYDNKQLLGCATNHAFNEEKNTQ